jgi:hypothetical protein
MNDTQRDPRYFVLRQEDDETWKLITQLLEPVEAASREEAIVKATEGLDAKEQNGAFLVLSENEYEPINRTGSRRRSTSSSDGPVVLAQVGLRTTDTRDAPTHTWALEGLGGVLTRAFRPVSSP